MTARSRALLVICGCILLTTAVIALNLASQPRLGRITSHVTVTAPAATVTPTTAGNPVRVRVLGITCLADGGGYRIQWQVVNRGPAITGTLAAQIDDQPPEFIGPPLALRRGESNTGTVNHLTPYGNILLLSLYPDDAATVNAHPRRTPPCAP